VTGAATQVSTVIFLLLLSFFFSGSEAAFLSLSRMRLRRHLPSQFRAQQTITELLQQTRALITTVLIGNEFVNVAIASLMAWMIIPVVGPHLGPVVALVSGLCLILLFGEVAPKSLAVRYPEDFALATVHPLRLIHRLLWPLRWPVLSLIGLLGARGEKGSGSISDEEFESVIEGGLRDGVYRPEEAELIRRILALRRTVAKELMTPRREMFALQKETTVAEAVATIRKQFFARIPVYDGTIDRIVGVVLAKDLLKAARSRLRQSQIERFCRQVPFVPETKRASELLSLLLSERTHLAVVVDEYGGTEGIVTVEDILEEIVGEILDEKDKEVKEIVPVGPLTYRVMASTRIEQFAKAIGVALPQGDYDTVGGFITTRLGAIPTPGQKLRQGRLEFEVLATESSRIVSLLVKVRPSPEEDQEGKS